MVGDVLQRGLEEVLFVALLISDRDLRYYESGRLGLGVQYLDGATSDQQAKSYGCRNLKNAFHFPSPSQVHDCWSAAHANSDRPYALPRALVVKRTL